ncbi:MAG TPA: RNA-binding protein [Thermodesulfobacteriota bacterium]|nr:RNA-binding protein [Thermodesulfobacteriota bacterium]
MNLFVGNLDKETTEDELAQLFSEYGDVKSAKIIRDIYSGDPRGFGFVEFGSKSDAINAINEMNGREFKGQELKVNEAIDKRADNKRGGGRRGGKSGGSRKGGSGRRY